MKTHDMVRVAVFAAILCAAAPLTVPVGPVPITFGTLIIYMAGGILGKKQATAAVAVYVLLGAFGLPVFSGFAGGFGKLIGPTGGYIIGYIPLAFLSGLCASDGKFKYTLGMIAGTAALYALGTAWFVIQTSTPVLSALALCVLPFLPGDAVKIAASAFLAPVIRRRVSRLQA